MSKLLSEIYLLVNFNFSSTATSHTPFVSDVNFIGETVEGENFVMKGRSSAMLEKNDGKWLFRHVHSSVPDYDASEGNSFAGN